MKAATGSHKRLQSPLLEVQVVDAADSIAYDAHDADDSMELDLLDLDQLLEVPMWREARDRVERRAAIPGQRQLRRAIVHEVIDWQVNDVIEHSSRALKSRDIESVDDVRSAPPLIRPSPELAKKKANIESFLFDNVYRHPGVLAKRRTAQQALRETFEVLVNAPKQLPAKFQRLAQSEGVPRATGDYLAGMTDRFAFEVHRRLTS
jgi:dGTPase